jgi:hypothetical protein
VLKVATCGFFLEVLGKLSITPAKSSRDPRHQLIACESSAREHILHMDSSLHEVWQAASGSPFLPTIGKGSQFFVGFLLLVIGLALSGLFALSKLLPPQ